MNRKEDFVYESLFKEFAALVDYKQGSNCSYIAKIAWILGYVEKDKPFSFSSIEQCEDQWEFDIDSESPVQANVPISMSNCSDETREKLVKAIETGDYSEVQMNFLRLKFMKLHGDYSFFTIDLNGLPNVEDIVEERYITKPELIENMFWYRYADKTNSYQDFLKRIDFKKEEEEVLVPPATLKKGNMLKSFSEMTANFLKKKGVINDDVQEIVEETKVQQTYDSSIQEAVPHTKSVPTTNTAIEQEIATEKPTLEMLKASLTLDSIEAEINAPEQLAAVEKIPAIENVAESEIKADMPVIIEPRAKSKISLVAEENSRTGKNSEQPESKYPQVADKELVSKSGKIKPNMCLIDPEVQKNLATVLTWGKQKYPANNGFNYSLGSNTTDYLDAALRHIAEIVQCKEIDPESGMHHVYHAMANLNMWASNMENKAFTEETRNPIYFKNLINPE